MMFLFIHNYYLVFSVWFSLILIYLVFFNNSATWILLIILNACPRRICSSGVSISFITYASCNACIAVLYRCCHFTGSLRVSPNKNLVAVNANSALVTLSAGLNCFCTVPSLLTHKNPKSQASAMKNFAVLSYDAISVKVHLLCKSGSTNASFSA